MLCSMGDMLKLIWWLVIGLFRSRASLEAEIASDGEVVVPGKLLLDIVRLTLLAQRRGESGVLKHLACFFKSPMGCEEHDFFKQMEMLAEYAEKAKNA